MSQHRRLAKEIEKAIGGLLKWHHDCHQAALAVVRCGLLPSGSRVARGFYPGIPSQHSWAVIGDPYDPASEVIDPTAWSYLNVEPGILFGVYTSHQPHGCGNIFAGKMPPQPSKEIINLGADLSDEAAAFMALAAPNGLDIAGWHFLANAPVDGWPAAEILSAMDDNKRLKGLLRIDVIGMLTDRNPGNLYR